MPQASGETPASGPRSRTVAKEPLSGGEPPRARAGARAAATPPASRPAARARNLRRLSRAAIASERPARLSTSPVPPRLYSLRVIIVPASSRRRASMSRWGRSGERGLAAGAPRVLRVAIRAVGDEQGSASNLFRRGRQGIRSPPRSARGHGCERRRPDRDSPPDRARCRSGPLAVGGNNCRTLDVYFGAGLERRPWS